MDRTPAGRTSLASRGGVLPRRPVPNEPCSRNICNVAMSQQDSGSGLYHQDAGHVAYFGRCRERSPASPAPAPFPARRPRRHPVNGGSQCDPTVPGLSLTIRLMASPAFAATALGGALSANLLGENDNQGIQGGPQTVPAGSRPRSIPAPGRCATPSRSPASSRWSAAHIHAAAAGCRRHPRPLRPAAGGSGCVTADRELVLAIQEAIRSTSTSTTPRSWAAEASSRSSRFHPETLGYGPAATLPRGRIRPPVHSIINGDRPTHRARRRPGRRPRSTWTRTRSGRPPTRSST